MGNTALLKSLSLILMEVQISSHSNPNYTHSLHILALSLTPPLSANSFLCFLLNETCPPSATLVYILLEPLPLNLNCPFSLHLHSFLSSFVLESKNIFASTDILRCFRLLIYFFIPLKLSAYWTVQSLFFPLTNSHVARVHYPLTSIPITFLVCLLQF